MKTLTLVISTIAAFAAFPLAGPAFAAEGDQPQQPQQQQRWQFSAEDAKAFVDARVAALKAGLELTPAQEKNWAPLEAAIRDQAKQRADRMAAWREKSKGERGRRDAVERLQRVSEMLATRAANLKTLAETAKPLYDSLDDGQKRRFGRLLEASLGGRHMGGWGGEHRWRHAEAEPMKDDSAK